MKKKETINEIRKQFYSIYNRIDGNKLFLREFDECGNYIEEDGEDENEEGSDEEARDFFVENFYSMDREEGHGHYSSSFGDEEDNIIYMTGDDWSFEVNLNAEDAPQGEVRYYGPNGSSGSFDAPSIEEIRDAQNNSTAGFDEDDEDMLEEEFMYEDGAPEYNEETEGYDDEEVKAFFEQNEDNMERSQSYEFDPKVRRDRRTVTYKDDSGWEFTVSLLDWSDDNNEQMVDYRDPDGVEGSFETNIPIEWEDEEDNDEPEDELPQLGPQLSYGDKLKYNAH